MEKLYSIGEVIVQPQNMLNKILSLLALSVPVLALGFVGMILVYKCYIKIRSKFDIFVNCWFCNKNTRVPYQQRNSWNCPKCEQYNGFNKDGDYNCDISNMKMMNNSKNANSIKNSFTFAERSEKSFDSNNGFCASCNEAQRLKVEKLSQFEPKHESRFDEELKAYKALLEEQYRLCATCEHHLRRVLREKKKMVLGAKFIDFIIRGAKKLEQPHYSHLQKIQNEIKMRRIITMIILFSFINIFCLLNGLPVCQRETFIDALGSFGGTYAFIVYSHLVTMIRVMNSYLNNIFQFGVIGKFRMLLRTLLVMFLYTLEMTMPVAANQSLADLYWRIYPFIILLLTFAYNIRDGLKFSRFTALLIYWSVFSVKLITIDFNYLMLISSIVTLLLCLTKKTKCHKSENSFHTISTEDYFSEDSISMLSQQLNVSGNPNDSSSNTYEREQWQRRFNGNTSPPTTVNGSVFGNVRDSSVGAFNILNGQNRHGPSTNYGYANSVLSGRSSLLSPRSSLFSSNLELHNRGVSDLHHPNHRSVNDLNTSFHSTLSAPTNGFMNSFGQQHQQQQHINNSNYPASIQHLQQQQQQLCQQFVPSPMHSPFSGSNASIYQQQQQQLQQHATGPLQLHHQQQQQPLLKSHLHSMNNGFVEQQFNNNNIGCNSPQPFTVANNTVNGLLKENLSSAASSLSSGFVSQTGNVRNTASPYNMYAAHETNTFAESNNPSTLLPYQNGNSNNVRSFTPSTANFGQHNNSIINGSSGQSVRNMPSYVRQPLMSNSNHQFENGNISRLGFDRDSFNLSKMNDELPAIKRCELMNID